MKITISWNELPKYAAYALAEIIRENPELDIVSIKSKLPIDNLEKILNKKIHWVENKNLKWKDLGLEIPEIFFQAGWYKKSFSSLGQQVKKNGGKVILLADNSYKNNFRQLIGSLIYRLKYLNYFDAVWVPGNSGQRLMRYYGVMEKNIFKGLYCSNKKIFKKGKMISERAKTFLYVGNLTKEKGFEELIKSFKKFLIENSEWKLIIVGNGPLRKKIPNHRLIEYHSFKKPEEISKFMQKSRFLIVPSRSDHWPLVVNESTLCGCGLILSSIVGNIPDLSNEKNSIIFDYGSSRSLLKALKRAIALSDLDLNCMYKNSLQLSSHYGINEWIIKYKLIIKELMSK